MLLHVVLLAALAILELSSDFVTKEPTQERPPIQGTSVGDGAMCPSWIAHIFLESPGDVTLYALNVKEKALQIPVDWLFSQKTHFLNPECNPSPKLDS